MKKNIWTESNAYRPENQHIAGNYDAIKKKAMVPIARNGGRIGYRKLA
jgi:hypothetical protein